MSAGRHVGPWVTRPCAQVTEEDVSLGADSVAREAVLPAGVLDVHGQQLDLRAKTTWTLKVPLPPPPTPLATPPLVGLAEGPVAWVCKLARENRPRR